MDIPDPLSPPLPIVHCFQQVFRATSRIGTVTAVCRFELVVLPLFSHVKGSTISSVTSLRDCTTEPMLRKKCVNIHCEEKTRWSWLILQNCYQETTVEEARYGGACNKYRWGSKTMSKKIQWTKVHKDLTIEQWNKVLWTDKSKFKIFRSNRRVLCAVNRCWKSWKPSYNSNRKAWRRLCYGVGGFG